MIKTDVENISFSRGTQIPDPECSYLCFLKMFYTYIFLTERHTEITHPLAHSLKGWARSKPGDGVSGMTPTWVAPTSVSQDAHQHKAGTGRTRTEPQQPDMGYGYPKKHPVVSNTCLYLVLYPWHYLVGICNLSASLNNTFQRCLGKI